MGLGAIVAAVAGLLVALGLWFVVLALLIAGVAIAVGIANWRWSLYGLLLYIPIAGVPIIVMYPTTIPGVLAKDILFVIPAYVGLAAWAVTNRRSIVFPGAPTGLLTVLTILVVGQAVNPSLPSPLTGIIGLKVWLLYIPLYFVGYHLLRSKAELHRLLTILSLSALVPAVIGIIEAVLIYGGNEQFVYNLYGDAASAVTQNYATLAVEGGSIKRVPSTFSFVTQYYLFTAIMIAVAYAWSRGFRPKSRGAGAVFVLLILASILSGARGALLFIPVLILMMVLLDNRGIGASVRAVGFSLAGVVVLVTLLGTTTGALFGNVLGIAAEEFEDVFINGFRDAFEVTVGGVGSGAAGISSRYAVADQDLFTHFNGRFYESWWVKVVLELGVVGLVLCIALFWRIVGDSFRNHMRLRDPALRATSAGMLAILVWTLGYNVKGQYIDLDPLNIYFWLFAGILAALPGLDRQEAGDEPVARVREGP